RAILTALTAFIAIAAIASLMVAVKIWRDPRASRLMRIRAVLASAAGAVLAFVLAAFWTPVGWRSSDRGIDALAARVHAAGLPVMSTLVVYEAIGGFNKFYRLPALDRKSTRLNSSHQIISYAVYCLK